MYFFVCFKNELQSVTHNSTKDKHINS